MGSELHPLNGKYIVFTHAEQDFEDEGSSLALFRLNAGELETIFSPALAFDPSRLHEANDILIKLMKKKRIDEVVSVFYKGEFFGIPSGFQSLDEKPKKVVEQWYEYGSVCTDSDEAEFLVRNGIRILFFDDITKKFI